MNTIDSEIASLYKRIASLESEKQCKQKYQDKYDSKKNIQIQEREKEKHKMQDSPIKYLYDKINFENKFYIEDDYNNTTLNMFQSILYVLIDINKKIDALEDANISERLDALEDANKKRYGILDRLEELENK